MRRVNHKALLDGRSFDRSTDGIDHLGAFDLFDAVCGSV
jgi:hypothetical protein